MRSVNSGQSSPQIEQSEEAPARKRDNGPTMSTSSYSPSYDNERITYVHLDLDSPVKLLCSPKAVKIAEDIVASLEKVTLSLMCKHLLRANAACLQNYEPEHWVDDLDEMFRKALPVPVNPEQYESLSASVHLSSISLHLVQDVLRPGDLDLPQTLEGDIGADASILCTAQLVLKNLDFSLLSVQAFIVKDAVISSAHHGSYLSARYRSVHGEPVQPVIKRKEVGFRAGKMRLSVSHIASDPRDVSKSASTSISGLPSTGRGTVLDAFVEGLQVFADLPDQYQRVSARISDCSVNAVSSAAELVTGTVHSWFIVSRAIEKAVYRAHYRPISNYRRLLTDILELAHREEIVTDPLFLNRPTSAAVHLRSNTDWKIMAHVRHILRRLSQSSREHLQSSFLRSASAQQDFRNLVSRLQEWHNWELDELVIRRLPLIQSLFLPDELPPPAQPSASGVSDRNVHSEPQPLKTDVQLHLATSLFAVSYYENDECTNKLTVAPSQVYAVQDTSSDHAGLVRLSIGPIAVILNPGLLQLVMHISRVRQVFGKKLQPLIPRPYAKQRNIIPVTSSREASCSVPVRVSVMLESLDVSTRASGVRAGLALHGLCSHASMTVRTEAGSISASDLSIFSAADSIKLLAVLEDRPVDTSSAHEAGGTLISIQFEGISTHAILDLRRAALKRHIDFLGNITSSRVRIPRSILKMSQL